MTTHSDCDKFCKEVVCDRKDSSLVVVGDALEVIEKVHDPLTHGGRIVVSGRGGVFGGGKGGGSQRQPTEDPNSLRSNAYARALFVIGEGQIDGSPNGNILRDVYLDKTPLRSPNGNDNFTGYTLDWRTGLPSQTYIPGFSQTEEEVTVGVVIQQSIPVVRTINELDTNAVRIRLRVSALRQILDNGDIIGSSVQFEVSISANGGPHVVQVSDTISGKCTSPYDRSYEIPLPGVSGPWDIRVTRITPDSQDAKLENGISWQSYTKVNYVQRSYPNTALLALTINAEQFSSMPSIALDLRGLRVLVPHNYDPNLRTYSGSFNGTLVAGWTENPVWCLYDLLTDDQYGAGLNSNSIDIYSFYSAGVWCDERVTNGQNGVEPRWSFSAYIDQREDAWKVIQTIVGSFNGTIYWAGGSVRLAVDRLTPPTRLYTPANVLVEYDDNGRLTKPPFVYSVASLSSRHTVAAVTYSEPNEFYEARVIYVEDAEGIARWGYRPIDITAYGCTSRTQAKRYGLWRLLTERFQETTVSFSVGSEGMLIEPGSVFAIADPGRAGARLGGRIVSTTLTTITLDMPVTLLPNTSYQVLTLSGSSVQENTVANTVTTPTPLDVLTLTQPFLIQPLPDTVWVVKSQSLEPSQWWAINVKENGDGLYSIDAIEYQPSKYAAIEQGATYDEIDISELNVFGTPSAPINIQATEVIFSTTGSSGVRVKCDLTWGHSDFSRVKNFTIEYKLSSDSNWAVAGTANELSFTIFDLAPGAYDFRVTARAIFTQTEGPPGTIQATLFGLTQPPKDVTEFRYQVVSDILLFRWTETDELDVRIGGRYVIRHDSTLLSTNWDASLVVAVLPGSAAECQVPAIPGTYSIKRYDSSGNESSNAASVVYNSSSILGYTLAQELIESPAFGGEKANTIVDLGDLRIDASSANFADLFDYQLGLFDDYLGIFDSAGTGATPGGYGEYYFVGEIQYTRPRNVRLIGDKRATSYQESDLFDSRQGLFDSQTGLFDGAIASVGSARLQVQQSMDLLTYSNWADLESSDYLSRAFRFRLVLATDQGGTNVTCNQLAVRAYLRDFSNSGTATSSDSADTVVTYLSDYSLQAVLTATLQGAALGQFVEIVSQGLQGFTFNVRDGSNQRIAKVISYQVQGY